MEISELVTPTRVGMTITSAVCAFTFFRALRGRTPEARQRAAPAVRVGTIWALVMGAGALAFSHGPWAGKATAVLPVFTLAGVGLTLASLMSASARDAFDALTDDEVRAFSAYRTIFGAFLFASAALGLLPPWFAVPAGIGDWIAGWLAAIAPRSLAKDGSIGFRLLVHGWGALDLLDVLVLAVIIARPWLAETKSIGPSLLLPWLVVPILFSLNVHGLRRTLREIRGR